MKPKIGIRSLKTSHVTEYLTNTVLPLPAGAKLPGIRQIMKKTGSGQRVVCRALRELQNKGLIRVEPCRSIRRLGPADPSAEIRLFHWTLGSIDQRSRFLGPLFRSLQENAEAAGRKLTIENAGRRSPETLAEELAGQGITSAILYGAAQPDFAYELKNRLKLCLELLPRHSGHEVVELRDAPDMTVRQLDYLFKRGYRRIGYLQFCGDDMYLYPIQVHRLMDYYRLMAENGLRINPGWVFHCSERYENLAEGMHQILSAEPKPEVLIVPGSALIQLYSFCRKHGIRIGEDLAIFSCDDISAKLKPEVTMITNNPVEIAETFWRMFQATERGEEVESRFTELFIRTGQTVPSLKQS